MSASLPLRVLVISVRNHELIMQLFILAVVLLSDHIRRRAPPSVTSHAEHHTATPTLCSAILAEDVTLLVGLHHADHAAERIQGVVELAKLNVAARRLSGVVTREEFGADDGVADDEEVSRGDGEDQDIAKCPVGVALVAIAEVVAGVCWCHFAAGGRWLTGLRCLCLCF